MDIVKYFIAVLLLFTASGCLNLRTEYPDIKYYRLSQEALNIKNVEKIKGSLMIRHFSADTDLETMRIMAVWNDNHVQRYYYHRWNTDCASLVTDFILERYNKLDAFTEGVIQEGSFIIPTYVIEGQIMDFFAYNHRDNSPDSNYVSVSLHATLTQKRELSVESNLIMTKTYNAKVTRPDNRVESIAPAFSKATARIADQLLADISEKLNN